jgi:hypothetical protein
MVRKLTLAGLLGTLLVLGACSELDGRQSGSSTPADATARESPVGWWHLPHSETLP